MGSKSILQKAKLNVETEFRAIGVLEDLDVSLEVFENTLPEIFDGAREMLRRIERNITGNSDSYELWYCSASVMGFLQVCFFTL